MVDNWTFKKEVSIGDLVAVIIALSTVFTAYFTLKGDIEVLREHLKSQDNMKTEIKNEIDNRLDRIENKLDRLVERNARVDK
jgi:cell division protein FtsL